MGVKWQCYITIDEHEHYNDIRNNNNGCIEFRYCKRTGHI